MPNRYVRDEIISIALNVLQLPNLEIHDMPNGVVQSDAYCIQWLQDILDFWYHMVPFSATVVSAALNCTANQSYITLPSDFILDVRNGYLIQAVEGDSLSFKRIYRVPLQKFINRQLASQKYTNVKYPIFYSVIGDDNNILTQQQLMQITPTPTVSTIGRLWYYKLPAVLQSNERPKFPNDYVCIEYLRIRALEWARIMEPGTAQRFCDKIVAGMKANGLINEPEDDEIPFDSLVYHKPYSLTNNSTYVWLGPV